MNKGELIEAVRGALGEDTTKKAAEEAVSAVLDSIVHGLKEDSMVQVIGFGTFEIRKRAARKGINPQTKKPIDIAASKTIAFKPSSTLKAGL